MCLRSLSPPLLAGLLLPFVFAAQGHGEPPSMLADALAEQRVLAQKIQAQVDSSLADAKRLMASNPAKAEQDLKLTRDVVETGPGIDAELRARLRQQVTAAIRQARAKRAELDQRTAAAQETNAAAEERERLMSHLANEQERIKQLVDRMNSLLDERRFDVAAKTVIPEFERRAANSPIAASADYGGRLIGSVHENEATWRRKANAYVRTLASVETSAVAFPDEPPIVYLDAEQWADITDSRAKYKSIDLHKAGSSEERIHAALNKTTELDFVEAPLKDVVQYLADLHSIPLVLATKKLSEAGIDPDTPVTKKLNGVTLRSALRLLLRDLELTYLVRDEVVQITTPEDAEAHVINKVYPVADLVVPIRTPTNIMGLGGMSGANGGPGLGGGFGTGMSNSGANPGMNGPNMMPGMQPGQGVNIF
jgi:hypothetical protein